MARILSFDYGLKRTGIAVTDPGQLIASPLLTVPTAELNQWLKNYLATEEVERLIVGMPIDDFGQDTDATPHIRGYLKRLKKEFPNLPVQSMDERYTSKIAGQAMIDAGLKKKQRKEKGTKDKIAAALLLQAYLEQKNF